MTISIEPYTVHANAESASTPITFWGIYIDNKEFSITSTREKAENTKDWMEKWLNDIN